MWLVVGLGNPGREYAETRHNIGFMVVDQLAEKWQIGEWKSKFGGQVAQKNPHILFKPEKYMNLSGPPVQQAASFYKVPPEQIIVVHDDIDLPFGRLRVKVAGGHGGHNGLRSLIQSVGETFLRVRCGVDKPGGPSGGAKKEQVTGHVLGGFSKIEWDELPLLVGKAGDAVELIIKQGATAAMNQMNTDPKPRSSQS